MEELIKVMSNDDLLKLKSENDGNESIAKLVDGILESRVREGAQAKAMAGFEKGITKLFAKLPHPDDIYNVYVRWGEVDVPDGEPELIRIGGEVTEEELTTAKGFGNIKPEEAEVWLQSNGLEMRQATKKEYQWIVQVNKSITVGSSASGNGTSKRAITIYKREGLALESKGNYASASKACEALGLVIGGDSATRVLARESYIVEPFTGELVS